MSRFRTLIIFLLAFVAAGLAAVAQEKFDASASLAAAARPLEEAPGKKLSTFKVSDKIADKKARIDARVAFSRNGKRILAFGAAYEVYDAETGKLVSKTPEKPLAGPLLHTALSTDGRFVACVAGKQFAGLDVKSGKLISSADIGETKFAFVGFIDEHTCQLIDTSGAIHRFTLGRESSLLPPAEAKDIKGALAVAPSGQHFATVPLRPGDPWWLFVVVNGQVGWTTMPIDPGPSNAFSVAISERYLAYVTPAFGNVYIHLVEPKPPQIEYNGLGSFPLRTGFTGDSLALSISSDEKWMLYTTPHHVEVRSLDARTIPAIHDVDLGYGYQAASPDAMRVAGIASRNVVVYQLPAADEDSPANGFIRLLHRLLKAKEFDHLDELAALISEDDEPFPWAVDQEKYNAMLQLLGNSVAPGLKPEQRAELIDEWVKKKPDSHLARLLLVQQALNRAWAARGAGFANTVTKKGQRVFREQVAEARKLIDPMLDDKDAPLEMYVSLFEIAKAEGWDAEECEPHIARLLERNPRYLAPHIAMAEKLMPRWGGEAGEDRKHVARVADAIGGPDGDAAYAKLATKIAIYETKEDFFDVAGFDYDRILQGWKVLQNKHAKPDYGVIGELVVANLHQDDERVKSLRLRTRKEHLTYVPGILPNPRMYDVIAKGSFKP